MIKNILLLAIILTLSACGRISIHKYKAHEMTAPAHEKIALLHVTRNVFVHEIDGKGQYSPSHVSDAFPYSAAEIELLPGPHILALKYHEGSLHSVNKNNFNFTFLPGHKYFLHGVVVYGKDSSNNFNQSVVYRIDECGSRQEAEYNEAAKKADAWLAPYVPACGK